MSKWFNARSRAVVLASVLAVAACDRLGGKKPEIAPGDRPGASDLITKADTDVDEVASAEPGRDRRQWRARSDLARTLTGSVTTSLDGGRGGPLMLAFESGITVTAERDAEVKGSSTIGAGGQTFASVMNVDPSASVYLYRVTGEQLSPSASHGGLCQGEKTTHVAVSEFVGRDGNWVLRVASFRGEAAPGPEADGDPGLCSAFQYSVF
jgi:hypothetical protein